MRSFFALSAFLIVVVTSAVSAGTTAAGELQLEDLQPPQGSTTEATPLVLSGAGFDKGTEVALVDGGMVASAWRYGAPARIEGHVGETFFGTDRQDFVLMRLDSAGNFEETGRVPLPDYVLRVAMGENLAVAVTTTFSTEVRFIAIDVSNVDAPEIAGEVRIDGFGYVNDVGVSGSAGVLGGPSGFQFIDLSDPAQPRLAGLSGPTGGFPELTMDAGFLYAGDYRLGVIAVDYRDIDAPQLLWVDPAVPSFGRPIARDSVLWVNSFSGISSYDVSDPSNPIALGHFPVFGIAFDVENGRAAVAEGERVALLDVSDPAAPEEIDAVGIIRNLRAFPVLALHGERLVYIDVTAWKLIDTSRTERPRPLWYLTDQAVRRNALCRNGGFLYVGTDDGLEVWELGAPEPRLVSTVRSAPQLYLLHIHGDYLYAAGNYSDPRLVVFDVSSPGEPLEVSQVSGYRPRSLASSDEYLHVVETDALKILSLADPAQPLEVGSVPAWSVWGNDVTFTDVCLDGSNAYIVSSTNSLFMADVADPATAHIVWETPEVFGSDPLRCAIANGHLYVGTRRHINVLELGSAVTSSYLFPVHWPQEMASFGDELYVTDYVGLKVFDTKDDPLHPALRSAADIPGSFPASSAAIDGETAAVAGWFDLALVHTNPPLENVEVLSENRIEMTAPAGMAPGPYHVLARGSREGPVWLGNAFRVVATCPLEVSLTAEGDPSSPVIELPLRWRLRADGDPGFFEPEPAHRAWLALPAIEGDAILETVEAESDLDVVELHIGPENGALVKLIGRDPATVAAIWEGMLAEGGATLAREDAHSYRALQLTLDRRQRAGRVIGSTGGPVPAAGTSVYRYEFAAGELVAASGAGSDADLGFRLAGRTPSGCEAEAALSFIETMAAACKKLEEEHPTWRLDCPSP